MIWVTPSDVRNYTICPEIVYYRKVAKEFIAELSPEMAKGSFEHEYRRRLNSRQGSNTVPEDLAVRAAKEAYAFAYLNFSQYPHTITEYLQKIKDRINEDVNDYSTLPIFRVEEDLVSERLGLRGRVDAIVTDPIKGRIPLDYKTGPSMSDFTIADTNQLICYAILMEESGYGQIQEGILYYTTERYKKRIPIPTSRKKQIQDLVAEIRKLIETKVEPEIELLSFNYCGRCPYLPTCGDKLRWR